MVTVDNVQRLDRTKKLPLLATNRWGRAAMAGSCQHCSIIFYCTVLGFPNKTTVGARFLGAAEVSLHTCRVPKESVMMPRLD